MKTRIAIIATCAGALVLAISSTSDALAQSKHRGSGFKIGENESPLPQDRKANRKNSASGSPCCPGDYDNDGRTARKTARPRKGGSSISDQGTIGGLISY